MSNSSKVAAVAYVPVVHGGYIHFFEEARERGASELYLIGDEILKTHEELDYLNRKDRIRALGEEDMVRALSALTNLRVSILTEVARVELATYSTLVMPDEDVSRLVATHYFPNVPIVWSNIFLRWHRDNSAEQKAVETHRSVSVSDVDGEFMGKAFDEAAASFDWWRQIGAVIAKGGEILFSGRNHHMPDEQSPNVFGDPRAVYKRGVEINLTTAAHGEGALIAEAAKEGISLKGASLYVTDFPCPYCARLVAHSGITKCYFSRGYAVLDGAEVMKDAGVELIFIDMEKGRD